MAMATGTKPGVRGVGGKAALVPSRAELSDGEDHWVRAVQHPHPVCGAQLYKVGGNGFRYYLSTPKNALLRSCAFGSRKWRNKLYITLYMQFIWWV